MHPSEQIGKILEDGIEDLLNCLAKKLELTVFRTPKKSGLPDFLLYNREGRVVAAIECKNHKQKSFWLNSQGLAYSAKFIGLAQDVLKVIVYTGCELRDRVHHIFSKALITLFDVGFQLRAREEIGKLGNRVKGLLRFLEGRVNHSISLIISVRFSAVFTGVFSLFAGHRGDSEGSFGRFDWVWLAAGYSSSAIVVLVALLLIVFVLRGVT